jgi:hypothetical protein
MDTTTAEQVLSFGEFVALKKTFEDGRMRCKVLILENLWAKVA